MLKTFASIFTGGGLVEIGAIQAGLTPIWGIEKDPKICEVFCRNFKTTCFCTDAFEVNPYRLARPNVLWASPPCQQWSIARNPNLPTSKEAEVGMVVPRFIHALRAQVVIVENVTGFRKSKSYHHIRQTMDNLGYFSCDLTLDAADFGVPQHRRRMFLIGVRDGLIPQFRAYSHVGWYSAVEDLIPTFKRRDYPPSIKPHIQSGDWLLDTQYGKRRPCRLTHRAPGLPSFAICKSHTKRKILAQLDEEVMEISPRGIARLMSVPDLYQLPDGKLAVSALGNGVPPLMVQRILEAF